MLSALAVCRTVFFFEEGIRTGGVAEGFGGALDKAGFTGDYEIHAIENGFLKHAPMFRILEHLGLDKAGMLKAIRNKLKSGDQPE